MHILYAADEPPGSGLANGGPGAIQLSTDPLSGCWGFTSLRPSLHNLPGSSAPVTFAAPSAPGSRPTTGEGARVLVAEDNADVAEILMALLAPEPGLTCVGAVDAAAAVPEALLRLQPHLLVLDMELRDGSGMDVLRECRRSHPELRVVILSGHSAPALIREARAAGAVDFLLKPDDLPVLADRLRRALSV